MLAVWLLSRALIGPAWVQRWFVPPLMRFIVRRHP